MIISKLQPTSMVLHVAPTRLELLNRKFSGLPAPAHCLVDSSIRSTADETYDFVSIDYPDLTLISDIWTDTSVGRI